MGASGVDGLTIPSVVGSSQDVAWDLTAFDPVFLPCWRGCSAPRETLGNVSSVSSIGGNFLLFHMFSKEDCGHEVILLQMVRAIYVSKFSMGRLMEPRSFFDDDERML